MSILAVVARYRGKGGLSVQILLLTIVCKSDVVVLGVLRHVVVKVVSVHHWAHGVHQHWVVEVVENSLVDLTHVSVWRHRLLFLVTGRLAGWLRLCHLLFGLRHVMLHVVRGLQLRHLVLVQDWNLLVQLGTGLRFWLVVTGMVLLLNLVLALLRGVMVDYGNIVAVVFGLLYWITYSSFGVLGIKVIFLGGGFMESDIG